MAPSRRKMTEALDSPQQPIAQAAVYGEQRSSAAQQIEQLPVDLVRPAPDNPRGELGDLSELAESVRAVGILEPLIVTRTGDGAWMTVAGHRRLAAAKEAGLTEVPASVRELNDVQRVEIMLIENLHREDLVALDEARGYRRLLEELRIAGGQRGLAKRVGKSQSYISKRLSLLTLPDYAQNSVNKGEISVNAGVELARLAEHPDALERAYRARNSYGGVPSAVQTEVQRLERQVKMTKLRQEFEAQGVTVVEGYGGTPLSALDLDPEEHASEPCHGARLLEHSTSAQLVCTDADRHAKAGKGRLVGADRSFGGNGEDDRERRRAEQEEQRQVKAAAAEARMALVRSIAAGGGVGAKREAFCAQMWLLTAASYDGPTVTDIAAVLGTAVPGSDDDDEVVSVEQLVELVGGIVKAHKASRLLYAAALAAGEKALVDIGADEDLLAARLYLSHLAEHGYAIGDDERTRLWGGDEAVQNEEVGE